MVAGSPRDRAMLDKGRIDFQLFLENMSGLTAGSTTRLSTTVATRRFL
jgi:hypothetical protein